MSSQGRYTSVIARSTGHRVLVYRPVRRHRSGGPEVRVCEKYLARSVIPYGLQFRLRFAHSEHVGRPGLSSLSHYAMVSSSLKVHKKKCIL